MNHLPRTIRRGRAMATVLWLLASLSPAWGQSR